MVPINQIVRKEVKNLHPYSVELPDMTVEELAKLTGVNEVSKLSFNESPWGPSEKAIQAMQEMAGKLNLYPDGEYKELRSALARYCGVGSSQIVVTNGADEAIVLIAQAFLDEGDEAIIPRPTFGQYSFSTRLMGAVPVFVPLTEWRIDLLTVLKAMTEKTKVVFLCNPNNPTGTFVSRQELKDYFAKVPDHVVTVIDEAYFEYVEHEEFASGLEFFTAGKKIIVVRTFSKIFGMAAARIGYCVSDAEIISLLNTVRPLFNVNIFAQAGAAASLCDAEYIARLKDNNSQGRQYLTKELEALGFTVLPSQTNFLFFDFGQETGSLFSALLREGVVVRTGEPWKLPTFVRVSIGSYEDNMKFIRGIKRFIGEA